MSPAYRALLSDVGALDGELAACTGHPAALDVRYHAGVGVARLDGRWERCLPAVTGDEVDLRPIVPVATALARWRNRLAASADPRLATFRLEVGVAECALVLAGQFPPDGSTFAPCLGCRAEAEGVVAIRDPVLRDCVTALRAPAPPPPREPTGPSPTPR